MLFAILFKQTTAGIENVELSSEQIEQLKALAARRSLRYQEIAPGLGGEGRDRSYLNPILFDGLNPGFSFFDIGSNLGYFCLQASARGAGKIAGVDPDTDNVELAGEIARITKVKAKYHAGQFEDLDLAPGSYDVVACLNVLHHMYDPLVAIHKMMSVAAHKVVLEFATPNLGDMFSGTITPLGWLARNQAAMFLGRSRFFSNGSRTFMLPREVVRILFNEHTALFEPVQFSRSPFKGRCIAQAVKRRIKHLVLVTGPTSVGKSTFQKRLDDDRSLRAQVGIDKDAKVVQCNANLLNLPLGEIDTLVVHYDMLRPYLSSIKSYDRDIPLQILNAAQKVTSLTLYADLEVLRQRLEAHELNRMFARKRHKQIRKDYDNASFLSAFYDQWIEFCAIHKNLAASMLVRTDAADGYEIVSLKAKQAPWRV